MNGWKRSIYRLFGIRPSDYAKPQSEEVNDAEVAHIRGRLERARAAQVAAVQQVHAKSDDVYEAAMAALRRLEGKGAGREHRP